MTNFFDEITSFFTILSEDREKLVAAPVLDFKKTKTFLEVINQLLVLFLVLKKKQILLPNNIKKIYTKNMEHCKLIRS